MRTRHVVVVDEAIELALELALRFRWSLLSQVLLQGLMEALDLALGLWVIGLAMLGGDAERQQLSLGGGGPFDGAGREDRPVVGEQRLGIAPGQRGCVQGADHIGRCHSHKRPGGHTAGSGRR